MGIEGGSRGGDTFGWILKRGEYFRNPELSPQRLNDIFKDQGGHGDPVLIEPWPGNFEELMRADERTAVLLQTASRMQQQFRSPEICLIGGLAVAAHAGGIYRQHDDLDFAVTRDFFESRLRGGECMRQVNGSIYISVVDVPSPQTGIKGIRVDFFIYDRQGLPYVFSGTNGHLRFGDTYPLPGSNRTLLGIPLTVAPRYALEDLKRFDRRPKGRLDYQVLTGRIG